jgi:CHAD domain-containing protein/CYTH domain-containing protein
MLKFPETLLDKPEAYSVRVIALALLTDTQNERERHRTTPDAESLHDSRVALRRLRSWLRAQRPVLLGHVTKKSEKSLRKIAQATNTSRDAEVFVEWLDSMADALPVDAHHAAEWLRTETTTVNPATGTDDKKMAAKFDQINAKLGQQLPLYALEYHVEAGATGHTFATGMAAAIRRHTGMLRRRMARLTEASSADEAHRARIAGKRLRYLMEPIAPWIPNGNELIVHLKALQDTLGALHDAHMWMERLRLALQQLGTEEVDAAVDLGAPDPAQAEPSDTTQPVPPDLRNGVMSIAQLVRDHASTAFDAYSKMWQGKSAHAFFRDVDHVVDSLADRHPAELEIERKYLLSGLPDPRPDGETELIEQGYLPGDRLIERLRRITARSGVSRYRTVKVGTGITRIELEEPATGDVFDTMWPLTEGRRVTKRRHEIRDGDITWQIDEFTDRELVLAEVELRHASDAPELPAWLAPFFVREVTNEPAYVNAHLAK